MTDDLIGFLRARLGEDEARARAAMWDDGPSATWTARPPRDRYERYTVTDYCDDGVVVVTPENADDDGVGQHVARHDPARVLREVAAKRRRVELLAEAIERGHDDYDIASVLLPLEALPYAGHTDYKETWRP